MKQAEEKVILVDENSFPVLKNDPKNLFF